MKIAVFTDPHLGLTRSAHTTTNSSARLKEALFKSARLTVLDAQENGADMIICEGDLFDSYSNPEWVIEQAASLMPDVDLVLAGNHDLRNRKDSVSSLQLLKNFFPTKIISNVWGETTPAYLDLGKSRLIFIPHVSTQDDFDTALAEAVTLAQSSSRWSVLHLHCNIGREALGLADTTLNLTLAKAEQLLLTFHRIFVGHEHIPRSLLDGRLIVIGNTHPTGFADISDKQYIIYDTEDTSVTFSPISEKEEMFWAGPLSEFNLDSSLKEKRFLDLQDDLEPGVAFKQVSKLFSEANCPFCIRLSAPKAIEHEGPGVTLETLNKLPVVISTAMAKDHPELVSLWEELFNAA